MKVSSLQSKIIELQPRLLRFAYRLTSDRDDAWDLVQDTTLKVLDNEERYVENSNFKSWAFTIMRNIFVNNYRKAMRESTVVDHTEDAAFLNMPQDSGFEHPEGAYAVKEINDLIDALPDTYRVPLTMHLAGYKYAEISEHTGLPLGTVKSRIFFARKSLASKLGSRY